MNSLAFYDRDYTIGWGKVEKGDMPFSEIVIEHEYEVLENRQNGQLTRIIISPSYQKDSPQWQDPRLQAYWIQMDIMQWKFIKVKKTHRIILVKFVFFLLFFHRVSFKIEKCFFVPSKINK